MDRLEDLAPILEYATASSVPRTPATTIFPMKQARPGKYLIGRFRINQDIQYRSKQNPGKSVGNDLYHIEQSNCFSVETAVLDGIFSCEQSHQDTEKSIREHPAPPYASVEERITQSMADQADGSADDRSEYCREKCQDSDSGLQGGIGNDAERNLKRW